MRLAMESPPSCGRGRTRSGNEDPDAAVVTLRVALLWEFAEEAEVTRGWELAEGSMEKRARSWGSVSRIRVVMSCGPSIAFAKILGGGKLCKYVSECQIYER